MEKVFDKQLPIKLKYVKYILSIHVVVLSGLIIDTLYNGGSIGYSWYFHIMVVFSIAFNIGKKGKEAFFTYSVYFILVPTVQLYAFFKAQSDYEIDLLYLMLTLVYSFCLYVTGYCVISSKEFYYES